MSRLHCSLLWEGCRVCSIPIVLYLSRGRGNSRAEKDSHACFNSVRGLKTTGKDCPGKDKGFKINVVALPFCCTAFDHFVTQNFHSGLLSMLQSVIASYSSDGLFFNRLFV